MSGLTPHAKSADARQVSCLDMINLPWLMARTSGKPQIALGLIDGPVATQHPELATENIHQVLDEPNQTYAGSGRIASQHGTFVAGVLLAKRGSAAPAICPGCSLIVRPIFKESANANGNQAIPNATAEELAQALVDVIDAGVRIVNLSAAVSSASRNGEHALQLALTHALRRKVLIVAAAGNFGAIGSSIITRHPWVIPVIAYDRNGFPLPSSNLAASIGRRGLGAPGDNVTSLGVTGVTSTMSGSSVAVAFVTGALGLLCSEFPSADNAHIKLAAVGPKKGHEINIVPALFDARRSHQRLAEQFEGG